MNYAQEPGRAGEQRVLGERRRRGCRRAGDPGGGGERQDGQLLCGYDDEQQLRGVGVGGDGEEAQHERRRAHSAAPVAAEGRQSGMRGQQSGRTEADNNN